MMTLVYDFIFLMFAIFSLPKFLIRYGQAKNGKEFLLQRFGVFTDEFKRKFLGKHVVWLHAVSVGEVNAARGWIKNFLDDYPDWMVALSTTTPTGQTIADSLASERVVVFYAPLDISFIVRRFLNIVNPKVILLMETEIWPNLIGRAHQAGIPIGIINGRISPRAFGRYQWITIWLRGILNQLSFCLVQSERDYDYFRKLGIAEDKLATTGNMKFDLNGQVGASASRPKGIASGDLILIGGSTHEGEEKMLLSVYKRLRSVFSNLKLILAPRHPERQGQVQKLVSEFNFRLRLFSELESRQDAYDVLLIDRMGILASLYSAADLVFIGGSFVPRGGQNPIEAAGFQKPILHGPNVSNFHEVYRILDEQNAAVMTVSEEELYQQSKKLLERPEFRSQMGTRAWASIQSMKGATAKTMNYLSRWILRRQSSAALV